MSRNPNPGQIGLVPQEWAQEAQEWAQGSGPPDFEDYSGTRSVHVVPNVTKTDDLRGPSCLWNTSNDHTSYQTPLRTTPNLDQHAHIAEAPRIHQTTPSASHETARLFADTTINDLHKQEENDSNEWFQRTHPHKHFLDPPPLVNGDPLDYRFQGDDDIFYPPAMFVTARDVPHSPVTAPSISQPRSLQSAGHSIVQSSTSSATKSPEQSPLRTSTTPARGPLICSPEYLPPVDEQEISNGSRHSKTARLSPVAAVFSPRTPATIKQSHGIRPLPQHVQEHFTPLTTRQQHYQPTRSAPSAAPMPQPREYPESLGFQYAILHEMGPSHLEPPPGFGLEGLRYPRPPQMVEPHQCQYPRLQPGFEPQQPQYLRPPPGFENQQPQYLQHQPEFSISLEPFSRASVGHGYGGDFTHQHAGQYDYPGHTAGSMAQPTYQSHMPTYPWRPPGLDPVPLLPREADHSLDWSQHPPPRCRCGYDH